MFMTRISDDEQRHVNSTNGSHNKSFLPDLTLKDPAQQSFVSGPIERMNSLTSRNRIFKTARSQSKRASSNAD